MNDPIIVVALYRCVSMFIGLVFGLLGYRLFVLGIQAKAGDFNAAWGKNNVALKRAAPGTFFALFGVIIISVSLIKGPTVNEVYSLKGINQNSYSKITNTNIDPNILVLIDKSIKNLEFNNKEVRIWNDWIEKHGEAFLMKPLKFEPIEFTSEIQLPEIKIERQIQLYPPSKEREAGSTDNKANSADAEKRASD